MEIVAIQQKITIYEAKWEITKPAIIEYLKNPKYYNAGTIFFIQNKLQVTYTFVIKWNEKDNEIVQSRLNGSPGN